MKVVKRNRLAANFYCWLIFGVATGAFGLLLPFFTFLQVFFRGKSLDQALRLAIRKYGFLLLRLLSPIISVTVENKAGDLPLPAIFVANHSSAIDPYLFGMLAVENAFVTSWPFKLPVYGWAMRLAGYIDARAGWPEIEAQGRSLLESGCSLIVWPEGHRSRNGRLGRFRKGAFQLAAEVGRPVVPVCILGAGELLPPGRLLVNPGPIKIIVLSPIYLKKEEDGAITPDYFRTEAHRAIRRELAARRDMQATDRRVS